MPINLGKLPRNPRVTPERSNSKKDSLMFRVDYSVSSGALMVTFMLFVLMVVTVAMSLKIKYEIASLRDEIRKSKLTVTVDNER